MIIRPATTDDAAACARIYAPYVTDTLVSFETEPPTTEEMASRIEASLAEHAWLVLESEDEAGPEVVGYAYATQHRTRAAYRWACDVSIYLDQDRRGNGAGKALYGALFPLLKERGYRRALAGIAIPNDASLGIHRSFGFTEVGTYRRIGWKFDAWHDVTWMQLDL
ncbi:arsinothricin resistance N-acetyltransferase ArsN1 family B [Nocardioides albus]|uniref:Phosphinothricin acetyltransferase n=1 Tax=Nocardioides albus TaxID=1841 RepID=A0A7W5A648_9ACTN|nr:arsinothricin resistance N-acetyltransferase ArsN1 family B [Nocardioides albus]MBB3090139.1 phosphinothricin acetyltransferase [Nocardioides albus]GGU27943.1 N-acetyltransferase [Nocardioides albus]